MVSKGNTIRFTAAAVYARVSTGEQAASGLGIEAQIASCKQLAAVRGWDVAANHVYIDAGVSGTIKPSSRPAMTRLLHAVDAGEVANVLIFSLDRLARKTTYILDFVEMLTDANVGIAFYREQAIDTTTAAGRVVMGVLAAFAQFEREIISERTKDALAQKRAGGWRAGRLPFGYERGENGGIYVNNEKALIVQRIFHERIAGRSYGAIAKSLNAEAVAAPHGKKWYASSIRELVTNEKAYRGGDSDLAVILKPDEYAVYAYSTPENSAKNFA